MSRTGAMMLTLFLLVVAYLGMVFPPGGRAVPVLAPAMPVSGSLPENGDTEQGSPTPQVDLSEWKQWQFTRSTAAVDMRFRVTQAPAGPDWQRDGYAANRVLYYGDPMQRTYLADRRHTGVAASPVIYLPAERPIRLTWVDWVSLRPAEGGTPDAAYVLLQEMDTGRFHTLAHWWAGPGGRPQQRQWVTYQADLSPLAGRPVRVVLRFTAQEGSSADPAYGWFVDDIRVQAGGRTIFWEDFEERAPVILLPGAGGSQLVNSEGLIWPHIGRVFWPTGLDVLRLAADGLTPLYPDDPRYASVAAADVVRRILYVDIYQGLIDFLSSHGYSEGERLAVFAYDWRKDAGVAAAELDRLVDAVLERTGHRQVVLMGHSMGGTVARYYVSDPRRAAKVRSVIALGTPYLGTPKAFKALRFGYNFEIPLIDEQRMRRLAQNMPGVYSLLPPAAYFNHYPGYFIEDVDVDGDGRAGGLLDFAETWRLIARNHNGPLLDRGMRQYDEMYAEPSPVPHHVIVGSGQATLGLIREYERRAFWGGLVRRVDVRYTNGDGSVPLFSASAGVDPAGLLGDVEVYHAGIGHTELVRSNAVRQLILGILNGNYSLPDGIGREPAPFDGEQVLVLADAEGVEVEVWTEDGRYLGVVRSNEDFERYFEQGRFDRLGPHVSVFVPPGGYQVRVTGAGGPVDILLRRVAADAIVGTLVYEGVRLEAGDQAELTFQSQPGMQLTGVGDQAPRLSVTPAAGGQARLLQPTLQAEGDASW